MAEIKIYNKPPMAQGRPDDFQTPPIALAPLVPYLHGTIWECACGKGNLSDELHRNGFDVIATDLYTELQGVDFLTSFRECDFIVTNPPFSHKDQFLSRCYELGKPFALLLPVTSLGGQRRQNIYRKHGLQIMMLGQRLHFETPSGKGSGAWQEHAWFTNWLNLPEDIVFAQLPNV